MPLASMKAISMGNGIATGKAWDSEQPSWKDLTRLIAPVVQISLMGCESRELGGATDCLAAVPSTERRRNGLQRSRRDAPSSRLKSCQGSLSEQSRPINTHVARTVGYDGTTARCSIARTCCSRTARTACAKSRLQLLIVLEPRYL